jgi:hypothetical protein
MNRHRRRKNRYIIDATENGKDGKNLKINFSTPLPNGGFEDSEDVWTYNNNFISLSGDSAKESGGSTTIEIKRKNPYFNWNWVDTADGSNSYMRLSLSCWVKTSYGTLHGPAITSNTFEANKGDKVSLYYYAKNTGDKYDVYGYVKRYRKPVQSNSFLSQRGDQSTAGRRFSKEITLPNSKNFVFEFLCGSQDGTAEIYKFGIAY